MRNCNLRYCESFPGIASQNKKSRKSAIYFRLDNLALKGKKLRYRSSSLFGENLLQCHFSGKGGGANSHFFEGEDGYREAYYTPTGKTVNDHNE